MACHDVLMLPAAYKNQYMNYIFTVLGDKGGVIGDPKCNTGRIITSHGEIGVLELNP